MKRSKYLTQKEARNLLMLPNGKQPLSAYQDWKPSDGYIEPRGIRMVHKAIGLVVLLATVMILVAASR